MHVRATWCRHAGDWLGERGDWPLAVNLAVPGERAVMRNWDAFQAWRSAWRNWNGAGEVAWRERRWPSLGRQAVPETWQLPRATDVASTVGETLRWQTAERHFAEAVAAWPALEAHLRSRFDWLADCDDATWRRLYDLLHWLDAHPASDLFARQLPVAGLDTKWLEAHVGLLTEWLRLIRPPADNTGFWDLSGLRRDADRLRLRILDASLCTHVGGLRDIQAPIGELARVALPVRRILIVENKQTGLACDDLPGTVLIMARGYAIDRLHALPWLARAEHIDYWGDIDTHGLAILGRLRGHLPRVQSVLMDHATLLAHQPLWVTEPKPHGAGRIENLTAVEQTLYTDLKHDRFGVRVRLEQERIAWGYAWQRLQGG